LEKRLYNREHGTLVLHFTFGGSCGYEGEIWKVNMKVPPLQKKLYIYSIKKIIAEYMFKSSFSMKLVESFHFCQNQCSNQVFKKVQELKTECFLLEQNPSNLLQCFLIPWAHIV
jgi:hypothetical protein